MVVTVLARAVSYECGPGAALRIYGVNFEPFGFFSSTQVFVGNAECIINQYYSTNDQLYCVVPPCESNGCLALRDTWPVSEEVSVSVYVQTDEGILGDFATFVYSSASTPYVVSMDSNLWPTCTAMVAGSFPTDVLSNIDVSLGLNHAFLGSNDALNAFDLNWNLRANQLQTLYYQPPLDMTAGFFNLSVTLQNSQNTAGAATGAADFFLDDSAYSQFSAAPSGLLYTAAVYPVVFGVAPRNGSLAGGSEVVISGAGFGQSAGAIEVLVGGAPCRVNFVSSTQIRCTTSEVSSRGSVGDLVSAFDGREPYTNASLSNGSPGVWFKVYSTGFAQGTPYLSFPWRQGTALSLWDSEGSRSGFYAVVGTVVVAPFNGSYRFFTNVDDVAELYVSLSGFEVNETLISSVSLSYAEQVPSLFTSPLQRSS